MLNRVDIMGRLTRDPELRYTQSSNIPVTSFTLAVDRDYSGKDGGEKQTDFIDCVAWRHTAEFVSNYFSKGRMAIVSGKLQVRPWEDNDGNKRKAVEVIAENVYFGDSKKDTGSGASPQQGTFAAPRQQNSQPAPTNDGFYVADDDDDLPF